MHMENFSVLLLVAILVISAGLGACPVSNYIVLRIIGRDIHQVAAVLPDLAAPHDLTRTGHKKQGWVPCLPQKAWVSIPVDLQLSDRKLPCSLVGPLSRI